MALKNNFTIKFLLHLLGWTLFFLAPLLLSPGPFGHNITAVGAASLLVRNAILMLLFYFNLFYLTPVFLKRHGLASFLILLTFLIIVVSFFNANFHEHFVEGRDILRRPPPFQEGMPPFEPGRGPRPMMLAGPGFASLLITLIVAATSSLLVLWSQWTKAEAEKQEQILQKTAAELTALKLQISPHFLFNTLNNIRWLVRSKSENAEDAIVKLSHLLRYILYQTEADKVDLQKELAHLRDFMELQKMRVSEPDALVIDIKGDATGIQIVPLLLLPLVENFFQHGEFTATNQNQISIVIDENRLIFKSMNKIATTERPRGGIGLTNVSKRLALHYPERHTLKYFEKDRVFYLELELTLSSK